MKPKVSVIVVGWNSKDDLQDCFNSLLAQDYDNYKIVFVDNNSKDGSADFVRQNFTQIEVLGSGSNLYFTGGNNFGIRHALANHLPEYIALINPDTTCSPNWISSQVRYLKEQKDVAITGVKVLFAEGFGPDDKHRSTASQKYINTVGLHPGGFLFPYDIGFGELDSGQYNESMPVFGVSGVSMMIKASVLQEVGLFYEPMQMYLEDADLCTRINQAGYKVHYIPDAVVNHRYHQSTKKSKSNNYLFWSRRNYLLLVWRNYPIRKFLRALNVVRQELSLWMLLRVLTSFWKRRNLPS